MRMIKVILASILFVSPVLAQAAPINVQVKGMVCGFCAQGIEKKFKALPEVAKVDVNLETKVVSLNTVDGKTIEDEQIKKIITSAGYDVVKIER